MPKLMTKWGEMQKGLVYLSIFLTFFTKGILFIDPDFGWYLRMGELISKSGVPQADPLSYTMPSFPMIDIEWLTNVLFFQMYPYGGLITLSTLYSLMIIFVLWIFFGKLEKPGSFVALLLTSGILLNFYGVRAQVISWIFAAIFLKILLDDGLMKKFGFVLPIIMLIWVNAHASFPIGIAFLLLFGFVKLLQKKLVIQDCLVIAFTLFATFINPYSGTLWQEVFRQILNPRLKGEIAEWQPGIFFSDISLWSLVFLSAVFVIYNLKPKFIYFKVICRKILPHEIFGFALYTILLIATLSTYRHAPFFAVIGGYLLVIYSAIFIEKQKEDPFAKKIIPKFIKWANILAGMVFLIVVSINFYNASKYSEDYFYPKNAIQYLKSNLPEGEIFSNYSWGGYLNWKLPEKKVFIDGRMPSWSWDGPEEESSSALADYNRVIQGDRTEYYFQKYNIDTVLWPVAKKPDLLLKIKSKIIPKSQSPDFVQNLEQSGWKVIYKDENAVILEK